MVEDVEKIRPRLKGKSLPEFELPPQRQIDIRSAESAQGISTEISLDRPGRYRERRWIDFPSAGTFGFAIQSGTPETRFGRNAMGSRQENSIEGIRARQDARRC